MATREHEIVIDRPPEAVFAAVADVSTHPRWQQGLVRSEHEGDRGAGSRGAEVRRMMGREVRFPYEITVCEAPRRWGFRATEGPIRPSAVLSFEPDGAGTRVKSVLTVPGVLGALMIPMMLRQQRENYVALKRLLESGAL